MEKEPIWENPTLMECVGKGNFQLLDTGIVPSFHMDRFLYGTLCICI